MTNVTDSFLRLTTLALENNEGDNSSIFAVNTNYNRASGHVECIIYPQRDGLAEEIADTPEHIALRKKAFEYQTFLKSAGISVFYLNPQNKQERNVMGFPAGPRPAWALHVIVPDTAAVDNALNAEIGKYSVKPDENSARAGALKQVLDKNVPENSRK